MLKVLILGLLNKKPMHGYKIKEEIQNDKYEIWADINVNSIYNALKTLERKELIYMQEVVQKGNQTKSIYNITEKGKKEYEIALRDCISSSKTQFPGDLYVGLSFLTDLDKNDGMEAIANRITSLEIQIKDWKREKKSKCNENNANFLSKLFDNGINHLLADYEYLKCIKDNFDDFYDSIRISEAEFIEDET